jgi:enhancing lycopene biosynthesis protein 2
MSTQPRIAVVLSGCGVFDGAEIHESVLTLLALSKQGAAVQCLAPNVEQFRVMNHLTQQQSEETRNVLVEAARIARGDIKDVREAQVDDFDAAILPGGYGAALNLSNYGVAGADMEIEATTLDFLKAMVRAKKPLGALCIAPPILAKVLAQVGVDKAPSLTVGAADGPDGGNLTALGAKPVECTIGDVVVDEANRIVTNPAYMVETNLTQLSEGIERAVVALLRMAL